jgi:nucleotide-binding universal stress UspA family protein
VKYANVVAKARDAEMVISSIVTVPYQTPLQEAEHFVQGPRDLIYDSSQLADTQVPVQRIMRYGHSVARGIISAVKERRTNLLFLGWQGTTQRDYFAMGSTLDPVIEQASCDVIVVKAGNREADTTIRRILFPSKGHSPHVKLAIDVIMLIARQHDAEVTILNVRPPGSSDAEAQEFTQALAAQLQDIRHSVTLLESDNIAESIVSESENHDMVVIGATTEGIFQQLLFGAIPQKIAGHCSKTVLMVKKDLGLRSWFRRWFS